MLEIRSDGVRRLELHVQVQEYFEHLFGQQNYASDRHLRELALSDDGWVEINEIKSWPRMRKLVLQLTSAEEIARCLKNSRLLEVSPDQTRVRRKSDSRPVAPLEQAETPMEIHRAPSPRAAAADVFALLQFNVLADKLAGQDEHPWVNPRALSWRHRFQLILTKIQQSGADLVCLQEVQGIRHMAMHDSDDQAMSGAHSRDFHEAARRMGYNSFWRRKDSKGVVDIGNMILYREDVFNVLAKFHWRYFDSRPTSLGLMQRALPLVRDPGARDHYKGHQLAVGLRLQHKTLGKELLLINTHIICNYQNTDVQLAQVYALTQELQSNPALSRLPLIISGDFNVLPDSPVYRFLDKGRLASSEPVLNPKEEGVPRVFPDEGISCGALGLQSAYKAGQGREPETTNVKPDFTGCLDYIWFSRQLRVATVSPLPSLAELRSENGGLPSSTNPSDHIPIAAHFTFL